jgi:hypothetical protein
VNPLAVSPAGSQLSAIENSFPSTNPTFAVIQIFKTLPDAFPVIDTDCPLISRSFEKKSLASAKTKAGRMDWRISNHARIQCKAFFVIRIRKK